MAYAIKFIDADMLRRHTPRRTPIINILHCWSQNLLHIRIAKYFRVITLDYYYMNIMQKSEDLFHYIRAIYELRWIARIWIN